ncbi:organic solute transporter subunit alpha/Transmembrane protein, partial [Ochromonadaceae sp. CCMP2298]
TLPISLYHTWDHLTNFSKPLLQSQVVRIIWLVPMLCIEAYLSVLFVQQALYFQAAREMYEAYVIHCFMRFILQTLGDGSTLSSRLATFPASAGAHKPPCCCLPRWEMGADFVTKCRTGVFQYVVVRFSTSLLAVFLFSVGLHQEGQFGITRPYVWLTFVNCCSQSYALYSLLLFYLCVHKELQDMRPFAKFLSIKLMLFCSWWQALLIGIAVLYGRIEAGGGHSARENAVLLRCSIISVEMLVAALAFMGAFPVSEF